MPTYQPQYHRDLPQSLFFKRDSSPRQPIQSPNKLSPDELAHLMLIRDRVLDLYFPPSVKDAWGKPEGDRGWLGVSSFAVDEHGDPIGTRTYKPGHRITWLAPKRGGQMVERIRTIPYVWVPDEIRGKTSSIDGRDVEWKVWERSASAWIRHLSGEESILAFWDDRKGDQLTCLLFDIDGPDDPGDHVGQYVQPWVEAVDAIEAEFGVDLGVNWMLSGSKGVWGQIFFDAPISKTTAANLLTTIALRVAESGSRVRLGSQTVKHLGNDEWVDHQFVQDKGEYVDYTLDDGNIGNRNCRLPWASHHKTRRVAHFVLPDGSLPDSQVGHLFAIQRVSAEQATRVAGELAERWFRKDHHNNDEDTATEGKPLLGSDVWDDIFDDEDPGGATATATATEDTATEGKGVLPDSPVEQKVSIAEPDAGLCLPRHPVPGTAGQQFILLDDIIALDAANGITGHETLSEIVPMMYGSAWESLSGQGGLLRLYDWLNARCEDVTVDGVVTILMSRYIGEDRPQRRTRFASMVRSDLQRERHLRPLQTRRHRALLAADAARAAGITNETTVRILRGICTQRSQGGRISCTAGLIARVVGILPPDETDAAKIRAAKVKVGEHLKRLIAAGLLVRHHRGFVINGKSHPSVYEVVTPGSSHQNEMPLQEAATAKWTQRSSVKAEGPERLTERLGRPRPDIHLHRQRVLEASVPPRGCPP